MFAPGRSGALGEVLLHQTLTLLLIFPPFLLIGLSPMVGTLAVSPWLLLLFSSCQSLITVITATQVTFKPK